MLTVVKYIFFTTLCLCSLVTVAQQIIYSKPEHQDVLYVSRNTLNVIGKSGNEISVVKQIRNEYTISIYDEQLKLKNNIDLNFLPANVSAVNVVAYPDLNYVIYQYQKGNVFYCKATVLNQKWEAGKSFVLDTTGVNFIVDVPIYRTVVSEDRSKIMIYKIHTEEYVYNFTTLLFDDRLHLVHKSVFGSFLETPHDIFNSFLLDNDGNFVFTKGIAEGSSEIYQQLLLVIKKPAQDGFNVTELDPRGKYLDGADLQIDNVNKQYIINSFFFVKRTGSIEGLYTAIWNTKSDSFVAENFTDFDESLRKMAKTKTSVDKAFDDYHIKNVILKKDGGYFIISEDYTIHSRAREWYTDQNYKYASHDYLYPTYAGAGSLYRNNIVILNINNQGKVLWSRVIKKSQLRGIDLCFSFCVLNTGNQIHFLYNECVRRRQIISEQTLSSDGNISKRTALNHIDFDYQLMPLYSAQISTTGMIILCKYRNYVCLSKVTY